MRVLSCLILALGGAAAVAEDLDTCFVEITINYTIDAPAEGVEHIDFWTPIAQDAAGQKVRSMDIAGIDGYDINKEEKYGNAMLHRRFTAPFPEEGFEFTVVYNFARTELIVPEAKAVKPMKDVRDASKLGMYLTPNTLIPTDGKIDTLARQLGLAEKTPIEAARTIYDYLIDEFEYDWKAEGAGKGDVRWACDSKTGDCTDYHSMFLALCRNRGLPADHAFGYPIRSKRDKGTIPYYHCWARFYVDGIGWIPLDASEADKYPELREYNFGSQMAKLLKFTNGRDVDLVPKQAGDPLNYFIHPYAEADGEVYEGVDYKVTFELLEK